MPATSVTLAVNVRLVPGVAVLTVQLVTPAVVEQAVLGARGAPAHEPTPEPMSEQVNVAVTT